MVNLMHDAGIQVALDVVYNHTGEGNTPARPKALRRHRQRHLLPPQPRRQALLHRLHRCGNTLNLAHPRVLQMVMDSLRYRVEVMQVDGFRFDLATTLARAARRLRPGEPAFLAAIRQESVLSHVRLIAKPWDIGPNGYQLGRFPPGWSELERRLPQQGVAVLARRFWGDGRFHLGGSPAPSSLFEHQDRRPRTSINFVACYDGFTLTDLVSYERRHNEASGENNRGGFGYNFSWNCGVEGPIDDPVIRAQRYRQKRNVFATLLLSQGGCR